MRIVSRLGVSIVLTKEEAQTLRRLLFVPGLYPSYEPGVERLRTELLDALNQHLYNERS